MWFLLGVHVNLHSGLRSGGPRRCGHHNRHRRHHCCPLWPCPRLRSVVPRQASPIKDYNPESIPCSRDTDVASSLRTPGETGVLGIRHGDSTLPGCETPSYPAGGGGVNMTVNSVELGLVRREGSHAMPSCPTLRYAAPRSAVFPTESTWFVISTGSTGEDITKSDEKAQSGHLLGRIRNPTPSHPVS